MDASTFIGLGLGIAVAVALVQCVIRPLYGMYKQHQWDLVHPEEAALRDAKAAEKKREAAEATADYRRLLKE